MNSIKQRKTPMIIKVIGVICFVCMALYLAISVSFWPEDYFWVERDEAIMPVWVRGNIDSGVFVVFSHGGPGSSGTMESVIEVSPADGILGKVSPIKELEKDYAVVYWDQRHSGMSKGDVDPNDSTPDDFGRDLEKVIDEIEQRYGIESLFIMGQSWGHTVSVSYMSSVEKWSDNQKKINGYIGYKGNHEQETAFSVAREKILEFSDENINVNNDVEFWNEVNDFYTENLKLTSLNEFEQHYQYVDQIMGSSISMGDRILYGIKSSLFAPFNGLSQYPNNSKTNQAEDFMSHVAFDSSLNQVISRIEVPTLLIYGSKDLIAPIEVGKQIYDNISTQYGDKKLIILEESRHGAEHDDVVIFQESMVDFIEKYK